MRPLFFFNSPLSLTNQFSSAFFYGGQRIATRRINHMCNGYGNCPDELPSGDCGHRGGGPWYCEYEDDDEYAAAAEEYEDLKGENEYEGWQDGRFG